MLIRLLYNFGLGSTQRAEERLAQEPKCIQSLIEVRKPLATAMVKKKKKLGQYTTSNCFTCSEC